MLLPRNVQRGDANIHIGGLGRRSLNTKQLESLDFRTRLACGPLRLLILNHSSEIMFLLQQSTHRMVLRHHEQIGHLFVPNLNARIPNERGGYFVRTNSQGFRSEVEFKKERGERPRILFFGDSYTAGDGVDNRERFSDLVGEKLGAEVFNYALSGSGTDQQLLIFEQFAKEVEADLIVLCPFVENIERIKLSHRASIDRVTQKKILVPKPYFTLENGKLVLHHVPVPLERPSAEDAKSDEEQSLFSRAVEMYRNDPKFTRVRELMGNTSAGLSVELRSRILRMNGLQPHPDYASADSKGWQLMQAIIKRFVNGASPKPVMIVPIPSYYFFLHRLPPLYQKLYANLESASDKVYVADITTPLLKLSRQERIDLTFKHDGHFSQEGHRKVAELMSQEILSRKLLPLAKETETNSIVPGSKTKPSYILGLSCFYHNSAACLIKDGKIIAAAEEERFTRKKNDRGFPHYAANYCLEEGGIHQRDLAAVVYYDNASLTFERLMHTQLAIAPNGEDAWMRVMPSWARYKLHLPQLIRRYLKYDGLVLQEEHHRSHAASAFYPSPFQSAAILTVDGVGEWATASIGIGRGDRIELLKQMNFPHSIGLLYSAFTQFTGFKVNSGEYKMMGLAPYGEPKFVQTILEHLVDLKEDGSIELNMEYFGFLSEQSMTNSRFAGLFGGPARKPDEWITQREMDMARSIQVVTEECLLKMARYVHRLTGMKRLCLAGGVALNCVANGRLLREGPFEEIWIQPAAGDSGCAIGAALDGCHTYFRMPRHVRSGERHLQGGSYLGPDFSENEIRGFVETNGYPHQVLTPEARAQKVAELLAKGKVVGHFSGRLEFGPRALGARSIIGDARNVDMQATLNLKIKYRESFRPFAPSVLAEKAAEYFELETESPYMLLVAPVKKDRCIAAVPAFAEDLTKVVKQQRSDIPAVTHVDYSARVQTINRTDHPEYYDLISAFEKETGYGVIVNTSFNVRGEPIICTPYDAYRCFMRTEMDVLVLGNVILLKEDQPKWPEAKGHVEEDEDATVPIDESVFNNALRKIYRKDFLKTAAKVQGEYGCRFEMKYGGGSSTWAGHGNSTAAESIFCIPHALDLGEREPAEMAHAVTGYWRAGVAKEALRPIVEKLIRLGLQYPAVGTVEEGVSDSIYVMY